MSPESAFRSRPEVSNEDRYRALLQSLSTFVWVSDERGEFSVPQPAWEKYTGQGFDKYRGTGWISAVHTDDRAHVAEAWNKAVQSKSWYEVAWRCWHAESQSWRQCITRGVPVIDQDGFVREWIGAVLDIEARVDNELKRSQERLSHSEAQFRRLIESNIAGIVIANKKRVVDANDVYLRMLGCSREDLLAGRADWVNATPPDSYQKDLHALRELREHGVCAPYEKEYIRPDGSRVPILIGVAALEGYSELTWICVVVDLSEQKRLQDALTSTNEQLLRANKDLEQFAYSAFHDLQEPLRSIKIYTEVLSMTCREKLDGDALQALDFVTTSATRMELLLRGLRSYTQAFRVEGPAEPIDAGKVLKAVLEDLAGAISESGANIRAGALPSIRISATQLQQLFQNLVGNAIKYCKPGVPPVIEVSAESRNREWHFAVKDNGIGIEDEYKKQVFELFKRLHTQNEYTGTGIGLALCQRIVEHCNGRIWVESEPGEGSTFYFTLPG